MTIHLKRRNILFILSAPSGGGKTTICHAVIERDDMLSYSISTTSRPQRPAEVDGRDYNFVSRETFDQLIKEGRFYECAEVYGNMYGTRKDLVEAMLEQGRDVIMDLDIQGGLNLKNQCPEAVLIFILPPSVSVLRERLEARAQDKPQIVEQRLSCAMQEMRKASKYDYIVMNDDFSRTVDSIQAILDAERLRAYRQEINFNADS